MTDLIAQITPTAVPYDRPLMTAVVEARDAIGSVIVESINKAGEGDIAGLAKKAKEDVDKLLDKAGELKKIILSLKAGFGPAAFMLRGYPWISATESKKT